MPREDAPAKARRLLQEARVNLTRVDEDVIEAVVRGDSAAVYAVTWHRGRGWSCSCPAWSFRCSHVLALMLVTVRPTEDGDAVLVGMSEPVSPDTSRINRWVTPGG